MALHTLNALPTELLVFVIEHLDQAGDTAALARTNRRLYTTANPHLYQHAARSHDARPLAWAARHGLTATLHLALGAGIDPNHEFVERFPRDEWMKATETARTGSVPARGSDAENAAESKANANWPPETIGVRDHAATPPSRSLPSASLSGPQPAPDTVTRRFYAIHLAASRGHNDIIEILLAHGASFDVAAERLCACTQLRGLLNTLEDPQHDPTPTTWSPLHIAICHAHSATAKLLLSRGAPHLMECWADNGHWLSGYINTDLTALHHAAAMGLSDLVRHLVVERGRQQDVNRADHKTLTPLYHAYARRRWDSTVPLLLQLGADIDVETKLYIPYTAITPLGEACRLGHYDVASRLLDLGADAQHGFVGTDAGAGAPAGCLTPLHMCCMRPATAPGAPQRPLAEEGEGRAAARIRTMQKLIARGADLHARDCFGSTPMMAATQCGNVEAIKALLSAGVPLHGDGVAGMAALERGEIEGVCKPGVAASSGQ
ncbi:ankyrin [Trichocladium antarcticum]|uniref:Ankyrin n=1 Tax=Trichocladium antarcticum TaxID=1450529 RepID=A0AAN6ZA91_9PEZI|nr:ankyrin [Trichocladium antarcticum]